MDFCSSPEVSITKNQIQFLNPFLKVEDLINPIDRSWNVDLLNAYIYPDNVNIIRGITVSRTQRPDTSAWMYTESDKYSVKSGFKNESLFPDRGPRTIFYGPHVTPLLAFTMET